ncbi:OmpA family protein [Mucilaginibacter psychrotolerans]|uniref:OmpA family protein n=1 Tax=Mucilaginibacter psychrotolerans TaxID=1524096 RepID=A0A4Y8SDT3_9SPHI|nr:OmpA family protein [Mucilaginibacter psychrotolerans]TFF37088.1 OmpA family protein [Mucilaginibacter psychrotolerans]
MKTFFTALLSLFCCAAIGQIVQTPAGPVDLKEDVHYGGYLQNKTVSADRSKIIWYPNVSLYRLCGRYDKLLKVKAGYEYIDEEPNCSEAFPYKFAPAGSGYSDIIFGFDSAVLPTSSYPVLDATASDLRSTGESLQISGYASSEGTAAHNISLSRDRANSVKTYLVNSGVDAKKLKVKAYGETQPVADNSTEEGRILNRRVSFRKQ